MRRIARPRPARPSLLSVPIDPPFSLVNKLAIKIFNQVYFHGHRVLSQKRKSVDYEPFFYPLDSIQRWNRIYGSRGFMQYQCVVPEPDAEPAIGEILSMIARAGTGSFHSVLKMFGDRPSPGLLSFPRPGATLALDFPNEGEKTLELLERLDSCDACSRRFGLSREGCPHEWTELSALLPAVGRARAIYRFRDLVQFLAPRDGVLLR